MYNYIYYTIIKMHYKYYTSGLYDIGLCYKKIVYLKYFIWNYTYNVNKTTIYIKSQ